MIDIVKNIYYKNSVVISYDQRGKGSVWEHKNNLLDTVIVSDIFVVDLSRTYRDLGFCTGCDFFL